MASSATLCYRGNGELTLQRSGKVWHTAQYFMYQLPRLCVFAHGDFGEEKMTEITMQEQHTLFRSLISGRLHRDCMEPLTVPSRPWSGPFANLNFPHYARMVLYVMHIAVSSILLVV